MSKSMRLISLLLFLLMTAVFTVIADSPVEGRLGRAELRFLEGMIDHHQMALDMALDCTARADLSEAVLAECQAVLDAQTPEIVQMQAWLLAWYNVQYAPIPMADMESGMDHSGMTMAMPDTDPAMMMGMFAGFNRLEGEEYAIAWLEAMIDHHDDAIHMAERLIARDDGSGHAELMALAQAIIDAQTAEITRYEALLAAM